MTVTRGDGMDPNDEMTAALQNLAASADHQLTLFDALAPTPDRLAADFDHWWRLLCEDQKLDHAKRRALKAVALQLAAMTADRWLWTADALRDKPAWARVRKLAEEALAALTA
ncbi:MAG: hypothetical protein HY903_05910 [Deltaproteobacteria bacterium]|nr:hypothetical protein [Deltaproteobacteria bacterium]